MKVNQPPKAIVTPTTQIVTLPTKKAIVDGSSSTDDEDVSQLTYKWEIRKNPIKYEIPTQHSTDPTLTLDNLVAGNYTIRLTVTDANGKHIKYYYLSPYLLEQLLIFESHITFLIVISPTSRIQVQLTLFLISNWTILYIML